MENSTLKDEPEFTFVSVKEEIDDELFKYENEHNLCDSTTNNETENYLILNETLKEESSCDVMQSFTECQKVSECKDFAFEHSEIKTEPVDDAKYSDDTTKHEVDCLTSSDNLLCLSVCEDDNEPSNSTNPSREETVSESGKVDDASIFLYLQGEGSQVNFHDPGFITSQLDNEKGSQNNDYQEKLQQPVYPTDHINTVVKDKMCHVCHKMFARTGHLNRHIIEVHEKDYHKCPQCNKSFSTFRNIKRHIRDVHEGFRHECPDCHRKFSKASYLEVHKNSVHIGVKCHECHVCHKLFPHTAILKRHIREVHQSLKSHECSECHKMFLNASSLNDHINEVHKRIRRFECNICKKKFVQSAHCKRHINVVHLGLKRYECPVCRQKFSLLVQLKKHTSKMH